MQATETWVVDATPAQLPARSLEPRMSALEKANRIRTRRAQLKRDVHAKRVEVVPLVLDPPEWAETMKVWDLLISIPKYGRVKVNRIMVRRHISPSKTLGGLSERQRAELAGFLSSGRAAGAD
jgi:hypothetical protein